MSKAERERGREIMRRRFNIKREGKREGWRETS